MATKLSKGKRFALLNLKKIAGGKDPVSIAEEFIIRCGFDPDSCKPQLGPERARWVLPIEKGEELEVLIEGLKKPEEATTYLGLNVAVVPVRGAADMLAAALQIADGLVGVKVSLVGHYLVLSATVSASGTNAEELEYHLRLINAQAKWFRDTLLQELDWEEESLE